jgi:hypothetical protein
MDRGDAVQPPDDRGNRLDILPGSGCPTEVNCALADLGLQPGVPLVPCQETA